MRHGLEWLPNRPWALAEPKARSAYRTIPLIAPALAALRAQRASQDAERLHAGELWQDNNLVFANELVDPILGLQDILGHSTIAMTRRYSHVLSPMLQDTAERLERVFAAIGAAN